MRVKHENMADCRKCNEILQSAHPALKDWFYAVRSIHIDAHVSCAFRNEIDQNAAFNNGFSKVKWPKSAHNKIPSRAIDLFQLNENGKALWDGVWFARLWAKCQHKDLIWGGSWKTFKDAPHFQLVEEVE